MEEVFLIGVYEFIFFLRTGFSENFWVGLKTEKMQRKKYVFAGSMCKLSVLGWYDVSSNNQIYLML